MKYIVTGGAGFIGSHLTDALLLQGHRVVALDNLSTGSLENLASALNFFPKTFRFVQADLRQPGLLESLVAPGDTVVHLAATVGVKKVCQDPNETWRNNFHPTELLADLVRRNRGKMLFASTSEVYGEAEQGVLREDAPASVHANLGGRSAYILGKLMSEHVCLNAHQTHGTHMVVARFFNTTGPRQSAEFGMVMPTFLSQALRGEALTVFGNGSQTRTFCDVRDTVSALLALLECPATAGEIVNIGNPDAITMLELARCVRETMASESEIRLLPMPPEREGHRDIAHRRPCIAKIKRLAGWQPQFDLGDIFENMLRHSTDFERPVSGFDPQRSSVIL